MLSKVYYGWTWGYKKKVDPGETLGDLWLA